MTNPNGSKWIRPEKRKRIYQRDEWHCLWCGCDLGPDSCGLPTLDHLIPREQGGSNRAENLITSCGICNSQRKNLSVFQFARKLWSPNTSNESFWVHMVIVLDRIVRHIARPLPPKPMIAVDFETRRNWGSAITMNSRSARPR
jgi:hypothetical protein